MSKLRQTDHSLAGVSRMDQLRRRWPLYAGLGVLAILALAYIDGGEEPIRPIVQHVTLGSEQSGAN